MKLKILTQELNTSQKTNELLVEVSLNFLFAINLYSFKLKSFSI